MLSQRLEPVRPLHHWRHPPSRSDPSARRSGNMKDRAALPVELPPVSPVIEMDVDEDSADCYGKNGVSASAAFPSSLPPTDDDQTSNIVEDVAVEDKTEEDNSTKTDANEGTNSPDHTTSSVPEPPTLQDSSDEEAEKTPKIATKTSKVLLRRNILDDSDDEPDANKPAEINNEDSFFEKNGLDDLELLDREPTAKPRSTIEREIDFRRNMLEDSDDEPLTNIDMRESKEKTVDRYSKKGSSDSSSDSDDEKKGKKPENKPERKERQSKKKAMDEMADLHKESQRLARETKVAMPYHTAAPLSLDQFFDLMKPAEKPVQKKPSFINIDLGDEEPVAAPPTKLDRFINRFLTHARQPVPKTTVVEPQETKQFVAPQISVESMTSMDNLFESVPPADVPVAERVELAPLVKEPSKEAAFVKQSVYDLPGLASKLQNQKPGAKLSLLKAALEVGINEKKERFIQRQQEEYAKQKALEPQEEVVEEEEEEECDGEFSDDEGSSSSDESEPDEAEIVDENYGKDEPEIETNEFADNEAEEGSDEEDSGDGEEEFLEGDVDLEKESDGSDDEVLNEKDRRAAVDDDEDDPLAGLVATPSISPGSEEDDETSRHFTLEGPGNAPGSLIDDMDPTQRAKLLRLCSFSSQNNLSSQTQPSQTPSSPRFEGGSDGFSQAPAQQRNEIMGTFDNAEERDELMGLLSCVSDDFKTAPPVQSVHALKYDDLPAEPDEENEPLIKRPQETSKKTAQRRARVLLDDDDEEEQEVVKQTEVTESIWEKEDAEGKPLLDEEAKEEDEEEPKTKRYVRVEEESEDDADDEQGDDIDVDDEEEDEEESSQEPPTEDDEEGFQENLERQFKGKASARRVKASEFLEEQAEESEDEFYRGSGDEDEDAMDELNEDDLAAVDDTYFSVSKQLKQAMPEYLRKLAEDDQEREEYLMDRIQALQEDENLPQMPVTYFGDGATFRLNMDGDCVSDDENLDNKEDEVADNAWRVTRFERDQALASLAVEDQAVGDEDVLLRDNPFSVFSKKIRARENADISFEMRAETSFTEESGGKAVASFKRNSILSRGSEVLARLNEVIDVEERPVMSAALIALQNGSTRKGLTIDGDRREKLQRTESCPAESSDGPPTKRRRTDYAQNNKKPSVFSLLGH
ncbi:hypothetical protein RvY_10663 [Ramazzottius varieornatus]|uniref:Claspin n=1 Tax=Ramazzottius varieornatus TaxID=947166 RepID=A0A1D1VLB1_RAMVA|nr:hypothetical protein RvY_10663 [Ramazzottius varieornatus]